MKTTTMMAAATLALGAAGSALANPGDPVYPHIGTINPVNYTFEVATTGDVKLYFIGSDAGDTDDVSYTLGTTGTAATATQVFDNHASTRGQWVDLGQQTAGEVITFYMYNEATKDTYSSGPTPVGDGISHVWSTVFNGDATYNIPLSTFISFEDLPKGSSDYDYNDVAFSATNVVAVPEPANLALLMAGLGLVGFMARRRRG